MIERNKLLKKNISLGALYKVLGMVLSYISIPFVLDYLGDFNYGVWVTLFSIITWVYTFDIGVGNGLKIKLTAALSSNDNKSANEYISTAYGVIFVITLLFFCVGTLSVWSLNLSELLSIEFVSGKQLQLVLYISFLFVLSNFVIGLYKQILFATHKSSLVGLSNVIYQSLVIVGVIVADRLSTQSLIVIAVVYGISNLIVGFLFSINIFISNTSLIPNPMNVNLGKIRDITGLGVEFFVIQMCVIVIFTTDNVIITKLLGPEFVTSYSLVAQLFNSFIVLWYVISAPLTPLFTDAYVNNDIEWIKRTIIKLNKLFFIVCVFVAVAIIVADRIINLWVGKANNFPQYIFLLFGLFVIIRIYGDLYMSFLNSIGKLRLQLLLSIIGAIINIPLSFYFVKTIGLGSS
ncbi:polysaccharide biosynthesis protein, partial [Vibrio sp. Isolate31]|uniref:MATE family efflux transporter n=1 Tax=Vibrio sp. Isolate31 TaxID=2908537 RepID=UPI001EFC9828